MKYLIITADDLGLTKSINEGIVKACTEGIVTAASVIPAGDAFDDAVQVIKCLPFKGIGAHLALTEIKPLLSTSRFIKDHNGLFFSMLSGSINRDSIYAELKAQLELIKANGLTVTHINSHEHIHMMPSVLEIFIQLAKEYNIPAIRFPRGDRPPRSLSLKENYRSFVLNYFAGMMKKKLEGSGLTYTDNFIGLLDAGRLDIDKLKTMLGTLEDGVTEIVAHPGFLSPEVLDNFSWHRGGETELFALTDNRIKNAVKNNGIKLISFDEFLTLKK
jgi:predicted glycoside hydrolase/deacetylase ChbG (UPF0249 family)